MNYRMIFNIIGKVLTVEAAFMLPALLISAFRGETAAVIGIAAAMVIMLAIGVPNLFYTPKKKDIFARDGLVTAGLAWIVVSLLGALPFCISGAVPNYVDCFFETVSGFTTTGASILTDVESLPMGLLYWRSFTHWLGGMGVLVFLMILNPLSAKNSGENMHILRAESPGIKITKLVPRMSDSAAILYLIYIVLTVLEFLALVCGRVPVFDSLTLSFGTAGTGGFSIRNDSLMSYSAYAQWVVTVFMFLFSLNFGLYFLLLHRRFRQVLRNEELRGFACIVAAAVILVVWNTRGYFESFGEALRHCAFQVLTAISTSGFGTTDFDRWPQFSRTLLVLLMFCGACASSTGGGAKVVRVQLLFKSVWRSIYQALHPNAVRLIRINGEVADDETVHSVERFFMIYFVVLAAGTVLISFDGFDIETNFTAVVACMNNIGPGLSGVGPTRNYSAYSEISKIILSIVMLIGRLEIYPILVLFFPSAWRK